MRLVLLVLVLASLGGRQSQAAEKPNILWLTSEDHGPEMGLSLIHI